MPSLKTNMTIGEYQDFIKNVYGVPNDRHYSAWDMLTNLERFIMRSLKGIRKKDLKKTKVNLLISSAWFMSLMNQMHVNVENEVWKRFPNVCSYCATVPCQCKTVKSEKRKKVLVQSNKHPQTFENFQIMFEKIYPSKKRTIEDAGIHLAEEMGELAEAFLAYRGKHKESDFNNIKNESADLFSCIMGVCNSLKINFTEELMTMFSKNCHVCKKAPCRCKFDFIIEFKS